MQSSGLADLSLGSGGERRRLEAKDSSLRTFRSPVSPVRVVDEAELGSSATFLPKMGQRSGVCLCVYLYMKESVATTSSSLSQPQPHGIRSQAPGQVSVRE